MLSSTPFLPALVLCSAFAVCPRVTATAPRPNIVLILADDMGYSDISRFGSKIKTPNIDRIGAEGLTFTQFYNMPRCSPTRAALLTGIHSHQAGLGEVPAYGHLVGGPGYLPHPGDHGITIAEALRPAGYTSYMAGKWHLGRERPHWPVDRGFDDSAALIDCCGNFFERMKQLGVINRKWKLSRPEGRVPKWDSLDAAQRREWATRMEIYAAMSTVMDHHIGRVLDTLEQREGREGQRVLRGLRLFARTLA
jgi:arylsulfatase A-like enzyme